MLKSSAPVFRLVVLTLLLLSTSISTGKTPSGAAAAAAPSVATDQPDLCLADEKCKEFYDIARRQSEAGQLEAALINYQNAYARKPAPWLLISIGRIYHRSQRFQIAIDNFQKYLDHPVGETEEELRSTAATYIQEARQQLEKEKVHPPKSSPALPVHSEMATPSQPTQPTHTVAAISIPRASERHPVYKKWWFWTIIGGVVGAGVAAGVAVGVVSSQQQLPGPVIRPF